MKKFMLIYSGDPESMPKTMEEGMAMIEAWKSWYGHIGQDLLDGGFPFKSEAMMSNLEIDEKSTLDVAGYLLIQAKNYDAAMEIAKKAPMPKGGGIHVFEQQEVPGM